MNVSPVTTKLYPAVSVSRCPVSIRKVVSTPVGDKHFGSGTGFHYRDHLGNSWFITNWHVLTGRRPDDPGILLSAAPQSPYRIEVTYPGSRIGSFLPPVHLDLYKDGKPIWKELLLEKGVDIAAIPVSPPEGACVHFVQDFALSDVVTIQPGFDVVIVGYPFEHNEDMPFPVWKKAMISTEPRYTVFGQLQVLVDTPGVPGMSGSPVFTISQGVSVNREQYETIKQIGRGERSALDAIATLDLAKAEPTACLAFTGIYAGSTGKGGAGLERLALGRIMLASIVDMVVKDGLPGTNPFIPKMHPEVQF